MKKKKRLRDWTITNRVKVDEPAMNHMKISTSGICYGYILDTLNLSCARLFWGHSVHLGPYPKYDFHKCNMVNNRRSRNIKTVTSAGGLFHWYSYSHSISSADCLQTELKAVCYYRHHVTTILTSWRQVGVCAGGSCGGQTAHTPYRDIVTMVTIVATPGTVRTVCYVSLWATAWYLVKPDGACGACPAFSHHKTVTVTQHWAYHSAKDHMKLNVETACADRFVMHMYMWVLDRKPHFKNSDV